MEASLVSVIVPCYNYGHLVHETLDSVLSQTYANWECIVVDDGSTDNTKEVVAQYVKTDSRFKYIYQKNKGLAGARNSGLRAAKGEYIQFLDADDILPAGKLSNHIPILQAQNDLDLVYGDVYLFQKKLSAIGDATQFTLQPPQSGVREQLLHSLIEDNMFLVHCPVFRSSLIKDVGFFNEQMITCEDWNFWFRCAIAGKRFLYVNDPEGRVYVRDHGSNMSRNRKNMWNGRIYFRKEADKLFREKNDPAYKIFENRNMEQLRLFTTRYELAYGNLLSGVIGTGKMLYHDGNFYDNLRDSLYWIKERILRRV